MTPQDESVATYETWPDLADYSISAATSARSAFNFIRGVSERSTPVSIDTGGRVVVVDDAVAYVDDPPDHYGDDIIAVPFADGYLLVRPIK
jgi:hypothetical protein